MKFYQNILQDIRSGQNIDNYITILIALAVAALGISGIADQKILLSVVLATLAMVSTGLLVSRQENRRLSDAVSRIENLDYLSDKFLHQKYDKYWFSFFVEQFEAVWREAEPVDPNHIKI